MEHLQEQTVLDFVSGRLDEEEAVAAHEHVDRCPLCRELVAHVARSLEDPAAGGSGGARAALRSDAALNSDPLSTLVGPTAPAVPRAKRRTTTLPAQQLDEYRVERLLGGGGMGSVYLAHDTLLDRPVAIKFISLIPAAGRAAPLLRRRFLTEARATARVKHPNVVTVHRVGELDDLPYIVYELIEGKSLAELKCPVSWPKALELGLGLARGLAAAHRHGVLHRDIKPGNIMIDTDGQVVVVDFGLAKIADEVAIDDPEARKSDPVAGASLTTTGLRLGTPRYMPPEAWRGEAATPQSDIYSAGVVLYELCAGAPPHGRVPAEELARRVTEERAPRLLDVAPSLPAALARVIDRCVEPDPDRRFSSAEALLAELEALQMRRSIEAIESRVANVPKDRNPYPGPAPFRAEQHALFFGRRTELRTLLDRLHGSPFVLVTGEAGVGKSSLCRAGLLPLIAEGVLGGTRNWAAVTAVPGSRPLASLCAALAGHVNETPESALALAAADPDEIVHRLRKGHGCCTAHALFLDPLDDLVTVSDRGEAEAVARIVGKLACEPAPKVRLLATARAEHLTRIAALPGLGPAIGPAPYLLLEPRAEAALREIIACPARLAGVAIDEPVVETLTGAAARGDLSLAALQSKLAELWSRRDLATGSISARVLGELVA